MGKVIGAGSTCDAFDLAASGLDAMAGFVESVIDAATDTSGRAAASTAGGECDGGDEEEDENGFHTVAF